MRAGSTVLAGIVALTPPKRVGVDPPPELIAQLTPNRPTRRPNRLDTVSLGSVR
jgi:hypothetical protein